VLPALKGDADLSQTFSFDEHLQKDIIGLDDPYQAVGVREYGPATRQKASTGTPPPAPRRSRRTSMSARSRRPVWSRSIFMRL
jgi:hypothetical protein